MDETVLNVQWKLPELTVRRVENGISHWQQRRRYEQKRFRKDEHFQHSFHQCHTFGFGISVKALRMRGNLQSLVQINVDYKQNYMEIMEIHP